VVCKLFKDGNHDPVIPLVDVCGKGVMVSPIQIGSTCVNSGTVWVRTVMVIVTGRTHDNPVLGVNVYSVVEVLSMAGDQVPVILLLEVVGKFNNVSPTHIVFTCVKAGVIKGMIVMAIDASLAHCPESGVNVYNAEAVVSIAGDQVPVIPSFEIEGNVNVSP
jgi:hypothetical protein|tara:strand:+ start:154 stop:639 length:486 start_codon:yes stop_codon:yes gene_type:complete